ncbi:hypothetical protein Ancab_004251 [Ancistrocladus abbreviatus]
MGKLIALDPSTALKEWFDVARLLTSTSATGAIMEDIRVNVAKDVFLVSMSEDTGAWLMLDFLRWLLDEEKSITGIARKEDSPMEIEESLAAHDKVVTGSYEDKGSGNSLSRNNEASPFNVERTSGAQYPHKGPGDDGAYQFPIGERDSGKGKNSIRGLKKKEVRREGSGRDSESEGVEISMASTTNSQIANMNKRNEAAGEDNKVAKIWDFPLQLGVVSEREEVSMVEKIDERDKRNVAQAYTTIKPMAESRSAGAKHVP